MKGDTKLIIIGGSAGSLQVILDMLQNLNPIIEFPIIIITHRKADAINILPYLLQQNSAQEIIEVEDKTELEKNKIYLAPADFHILLDSKTTLSLDRSEKVNYSRPSIDVGFMSAADVFGEEVIAVLLSGANADGVEGLKYIKKKGGKVWIQDPESAEIAYMPQQAVDQVLYDEVFEASTLADLINDL